MTRIDNIGNLPKSLSVFAKEFNQGDASTLFYECTGIKELENLAKDKECELTVIVDPKLEKGIAVGFDVKSSPLKTIAGDEFYQMVIYFCVITDAEFTEYSSMLHQHRDDQEADMRKRNMALDLAVANKENKLVGE